MTVKRDNFEEQLKLIDTAKEYCKDELGFNCGNMFTKIASDKDLPEQQFYMLWSSPKDRIFIPHGLLSKDSKVLEKYQAEDVDYHLREAEVYADKNIPITKSLLEQDASRIVGAVCHEVWHINVKTKTYQDKHGKNYIKGLPNDGFLLDEAIVVEFYISSAQNIISRIYGKNSIQYKRVISINNYYTTLAKKSILIDNLQELYVKRLPHAKDLFVKNYKSFNFPERYDTYESEDDVNNAELGEEYSYFRFYPIARRISKNLGLKESIPVFQEAIKIASKDGIEESIPFLLEYSGYSPRNYSKVFSPFKDPII